MCGRFNRHHPAAEVGRRFGVTPLAAAGVAAYNIAPTQPVPVVIADVSRRMIICHWGLIPHWAPEDSMASRMINARAETLAEKPAFREPLARRRCLVPADGFYEWPKKGAHAGQIIEVARADGELMAMAGLWEEWRAADGTVRRTFTIITVEPNALMEQYHHRMPAILRRADETVWLDPSTDPAAARKLLRSYPDDDLVAHPVGRERLSRQDDQG
ncbi:MAG: SOS response-associated peptidase [Acidobacteriota bacterium]